MSARPGAVHHVGPWLRALHEAGHLIALHRLPVESAVALQVFPGCHYGQIVRPMDTGAEYLIAAEAIIETPDAAAAAAAVYLAGFAATIAAGADRELARFAAEDDLAEAETILVAQGLPFKEHLARALEAASSDQNRRAAEALAAVIERKRLVFLEEAAAVITATDAGAAEDEVDRVMAAAAFRFERARRAHLEWIGSGYLAGFPKLPPDRPPAAA